MQNAKRTQPWGTTAPHNDTKDENNANNNNNKNGMNKSFSTMERTDDGDDGGPECVRESEQETHTHRGNLYLLLETCAAN